MMRLQTTVRRLQGRGVRGQTLAASLATRGQLDKGQRRRARREGQGTSVRRGITLLEVMIAVMVLGIGLIGVGALVSVGALQAQRASIDDRKAILGQAEARDDVARGFLQAENWLLPTAIPTNPYTQYMQFTPGVSPPQFPVMPQSSLNNIQPVCIDPLMVGAAVKNFPTTSISTFAQVPSTGLVMQRLTVNANSANWSTALTSTSPQFSPIGAAAFQSCLSQDDLKFGFPTSNPTDDQLPQSFFNSAGTKREFTGQYSWLMTLVPAYGDLEPYENGNLMTASIVVFNQRQFAVSPYSLSPPAERAVQVASVATGGYGGGSVVLSSTSQAALNLRVGNVIMLGWIQSDVPANSSGNVVDSSGNPIAISVAAKFAQRPMFRWYRIINSGPATQSGSNWTENVTLSGGDLNMQIIASGSMYAFIYDNAVAVYERNVRLEGPSMWTN